jgi:hypothetical protein
MTGSGGEGQGPIQRRVVRTRRVRRSVNVELTAARSVRLGVRLVVRGLSGLWHGRPVHLTLRTRPHTSTTTEEVDERTAE